MIKTRFQTVILAYQGKSGLRKVDKMWSFINIPRAHIGRFIKGVESDETSDDDIRFSYRGRSHTAKNGQTYEIWEAKTEQLALIKDDE